MYRRPIWCQRLSGGTWGSSKAKDGCITWSTSQSHTFYYFAVLCQARSHKGDSLGPWKISLAHLPQINSSRQQQTTCDQIAKLFCGRWCLADHVGPGGSHWWTVTIEWSICWGGKKKRKKDQPSIVGEKASARVNSDAPSTRNVQISINCTFDLTCSSNSLNLLGTSRFSE